MSSSQLCALLLSCTVHLARTAESERKIVETFRPFGIGSFQLILALIALFFCIGAAYCLYPRLRFRTVRNRVFFCSLYRCHHCWCSYEQNYVSEIAHTLLNFCVRTFQTAPSKQSQCRLYCLFLSVNIAPVGFPLGKWWLSPRCCLVWSFC